MSKNSPILTEEYLDFIQELMNIGAGNAVSALEMLLQGQVDLIVPKVHFFFAANVPSFLSDPTSIVACVRMRMVGDLWGTIFFITPEEAKNKLVSMAEKVLEGLSKSPGQIPVKIGVSAIVEIGNIVTGVYLSAIHAFCGLNICHTVPILANDMIQALLDETLVEASLIAQPTIVIENRFVIEEEHFTTYLLIFPSADSIKPLIDSLEQAKKAYGSA